MGVIAITGASGFIGQHLVEFLSNHDKCQIRVLVHQNLNVDAFNRPNVAILEGDLSKAETLQKLIEPGCTVVNLVYLWGRSREENLEAIDNLANVCAKAKVKRMIHCSTAVVVGDVQDNLIDEETICNPIEEYETTKLEIEELLLWKYGYLFELVILRPTAVFGRHGKNLIKVANDLLSQPPFITSLKAALFYKRRLNLVCVENVVSAILFLMQINDRMDGERFIISDDDEIENNYYDIINLLASQFGHKPAKAFYMPYRYHILRMLLTASKRSNVNAHRNYSSNKLFNMGFKKSIQFREGIRQFATCYQQSKIQN